MNLKLSKLFKKISTKRILELIIHKNLDFLYDVLLNLTNAHQITIPLIIDDDTKHINNANPLN